MASKKIAKKNKVNVNKDKPKIKNKTKIKTKIKNNKISSKKDNKKSSKKDNKNKEFDTKADKLVVKGKERGFVTYDEILKEFPNIETDIMFLDSIFKIFFFWY
jgi:hypothetical protein